MQINRTSEATLKSIVLVCAATVALGCPGERRANADSARAAVPVDTVATDLSKVQTSLPPALPDTFKEPDRGLKQFRLVYSLNDTPGAKSFRNLYKLPCVKSGNIP